MIRITVINRQGVQVPGAFADFGPLGGTIGRADTNALALNDPDRTVSRVHAQVLCRDGRYFIVDRGSNPLHCDGVAVGAGNEAPLQGGERLVIGGFELAVTAVAAAPAADGSPALHSGSAPATGPILAASDDPFSDLLVGLGTSASALPDPAPAPAPAPAPQAAVLAAHPDPMSTSLGHAAATLNDPFADLLGGLPQPTGASAVAASTEPFSDLGVPAASGPTARAPSIDELFGGMGFGLDADPLALSPLADPLRQPNTAARDDPLAALGQLPTSAQAARSDHLPIGHFGFVPPQALPSGAVARAPVAAPESVAAAAQPMQGLGDSAAQPIRISRAPAALPGDAVVPPPQGQHSALPGAAARSGDVDAFDDLLGTHSGAPSLGLDDLLAGLVPDAAGPQLASPPVAEQLPPPTFAPAATPAIPPIAAMPPAPAPASASAPAPASASAPAAAVLPLASVQAGSPVAAPSFAVAATAASSDADLLAAFRRGLGPMHQAPTTLTPALLERIGSLLRASTEGTLQLLLTRQELKREVRAEVTMIAAQANNPLKFSPTVDVALTHLLGPGIRGFMPAEQAMRDAYDDLRAHQFGVMVGLRAALEQLIARFEPQQLESKIAAKSALDSLFAANRKAKLWDQFTALYGGIAAEAEDDFHTLFGKAFLKAYEEQMARLKTDGTSAT